MPRFLNTREMMRTPLHGKTSSIRNQQPQPLGSEDALESFKTRMFRWESVHPLATRLGPNHQRALNPTGYLLKNLSSRCSQERIRQ